MERDSKDQLSRLPGCAQIKQGNGGEEPSDERRRRAAAVPRITAADLGLPESVGCPFCKHSETELHSGFGSQLSVSTYWCRRCHTAFEYIKWRSTST